LTKDYPDIIGEYWTSGTDEGCDGNYRWCSVDRAFLKKQVLWGTSEPKNATGDCVWTRTTNNPKNSTLHVQKCSTKKKFICEVFINIFVDKCTAMEITHTKITNCKCKNTFLV